MMSKIARPDWQDGEPVQHLTPIGEESSSVIVSPEEGQAIIDVAEANALGEPEPTRESSAPLLADWPEDKAELVEDVVELILDAQPDLEGLVAEFDTLPESIQRKVAVVMHSHPHLRGLDLIAQVERTLTLEEAAAAEEWARALPEEIKEGLVEG